MHNNLGKTIVAATLLWWFAPAGESRAQGIGVGIISSDLDRALAPGATIPYQQDPFSHRYSYYSGPTFSFTIGRSASKFDYLEYIDRVERAEKFGYRIPAPPPGWVPVYSRPRPCTVVPQP